MNELMRIEMSQTMTSREMAVVTGKRHDSVKRTIEMLAKNGVIASPQIVNFKNINEVDGIEYLIGKRDSYVVVAQLSPEYTSRKGAQCKIWAS